MGNIKVQDEKGNWKVVSSSNATGIKVTNPFLQQKENEPTSVEDVLIKHETDVEKLKRNVSWLAKNGGGGGGGGSTRPPVSEATTKILVNGSPTDSTILVDNDGIIIQFTEISVQANKNWNVTVRIGSKTISSGSISYINNIISVPANLIIENLINHSGVLTIQASYDDDLNGVYGSAIWTGNILESTIILAVNDVQVGLDNTGNPSENKYLIYKYSTGIVGQYTLTVKAIYNNSTIKTLTKNINIVNTQEANYSIEIKELINNPIPGNYTIESTLTNVENNNINTTVLSSVSFIGDNLIIVSNNLSEDSTAPIEVPISSSINLNWYCVGQGVSGIDYTYKIGTNIIKTDKTSINKIVNDFIPLSGQTWAEVNKAITITIEVKAGDKITTKDYYFKIIQATGTFISHKDTIYNNQILKFNAKDFTNGTNEFNLSNINYSEGTITTKLNIINSSNLVGIKSTNAVAPYLKYSNGAYSKISEFNVNGVSKSIKELLELQSYRFSINICFKADYHPDDNRTIFSTAQLDNNTGEPISGIEIDVHNVYINKESVLPLSDNTVNDIVITSTYITDPYIDNDGITQNLPRWIIKIYLDGVMSAIRVLNNNPVFTDNIYIGGKKYTINSEEGDWLCDCNIYAINIYNKALNEEEILINYINNITATKYVNGKFDFTNITKELRKSFCELNADNTISDAIYDVNSDTYNIQILLNNYNNLDQDKLTQYGSVIGIPIMLIDVSNVEAWTFNNFSLQQSAGNKTLPKAEDQTIQYYDPNGTNTRIITINHCNIDIQGTSTLADTVKNLDIEMPNTSEDTTVFIPKPTWLPEGTYTCKADVVDSSHSNNASIGKFINEVIGDFFPYNKTALSNVKESDYVKNQQPTATLKHTVEGFPVLIIMKFHVSTTSTISVTPLGIYSFNLGRNAYRNLGFNKINSIKDTTGVNIQVNTFPYFAENCKVDETNSNANWIEVKDTYSVKDLAKITSNVLPESFDSSTGDFWQTDNNILNLLYEVRYGNYPNPSDYENFKNFVKYIVQLPIEAPFRITDRIGTKNVAQITGRYDAYTYIISESNSRYEKLSIPHQMTDDSNSFTAPPFDPLSFYRYFVIANLFGLADNFGKNSTFRSWNNGNYSIGFYDLDCAIGNDNQGGLTIKPDMWNKYFANNIIDGKKYGFLCESYADTDDNPNVIGGGGISAKANKIWLSIDTNTARTVFEMNGTGIESQYAYQYELLRKDLHQKAINAGYTDFATYFINEYYTKQCGNCGPLLFNLDYRLKYLLQFDNNKYDKVAGASKLHGRKVACSTDWINNRITFLDSWFGVKRTNQQYNVPNDYDSKADIKTYNTPETIAVKFSTPVIFNFKVGDAAKSYYYAPANTNVYVDAGANNSDSILTGSINNSPQLLSIGDEEVTLTDMEINLMNNSTNNTPLSEQGYPRFTVLDLHNSKKLNNQFNINSFKPSGAGISELRELNFNNAQCINPNDSFELSLYDELEGGIINSKFEKLRKIDISNSKCVSNIKIPFIPLRELNITNSKLNKLILENQNYFTYVDITGCTTLNYIKIHNCALYDHFIIENNLNIEEIILYNLPKLKYVIIRNCDNLKKISIQGCDILESITIEECDGITGLNANNNYLSIISNHNLKSISLRLCKNLEKFTITDSNQTNITSLDFYNTKICKIDGDGVINKYNNKDIIDLSAFVNLINFNCADNYKVVQIQFANDINKPIILNNSFTGCTLLERLYGHIKLNSGSNFFKNLANFSIHGCDDKALAPIGGKWKGFNVLETNNRVKTPWEILSGIKDDEASENSYSNVTWEQSFVSGKGVTNISLSNTISMDSMFQQCHSITQFDVYYIFFVFALQHTSTSDFTYTFSHIRNRNNDTKLKLFSWNIDEDNNYIDNAPKRFMFYKGDKINKLHRTFEGSTELTFIQSPTIDEDGNITKDNGVFSPLINCVQLYVTWNMVSTRNVFRCKVGNYKFTEISESTWNIVENELDYRTRANYNSNIIDKTRYKARANMTDLFKNLTALTKIERILNTPVDFDTLVFPKTIITINKIFNNYCTGNCDLSIIFNGCTNLQEIGHIFAGTNDSNLGPQATFPITSNTLSQFTKLSKIGYIDGTYDANVNNFAFKNLRKYINQNTFPYDIFANNPQLTTIAGFFYNIENKEFAIPVTIPNNLFINNTKLKNVVSLFHNFHIPYTLTSEGFKNCPNLSNVYKLFAYDVTKTSKPVLTGNIPFRLLYHGQTQITNIIKGVTTADYNILYNSCKYNINEGKTDEEGNPLPIVMSEEPDFTRPDSIVKINAKLKTYTNSYMSPKHTINDASYLFNGNVNLEAYENTNGFIETNPIYVGTEITYKWNENTKTFTEVTNDEKIPNIDWGYDGKPINKIANVLYYDTENPTTLTEIPTDTSKNILNYAMPGDLFRYCTNNCKIEYAFNLCGIDDVTKGIQSEGRSYYEFGLTGRICPYLLKPLSAITSIEGLFRYCRRLASYEVNNIVYQIPSTFFNYTPNINNLKQTFEGLSFDSGVNLNVFTTLTKPLDIRLIFSYCLYKELSNGQSTEIRGIFTNNNITYICGAFSASRINNLSEYNGTPDPLWHIKSTGVKFINNFTASKLPTNTTNIRLVYYDYIHGTEATDSAIPITGQNYGN